MEDPGWDPLGETHTIIEDMLGLIQGPLREHTRVRLALLTYCHLIEVDAIYNILKNMLRVIEGERYSIEPFWGRYRSKSKKKEKSRLEGVIPPSAKIVVTDLREHARRLGEDDLADVIEQMFDDEVRNAFFHSDYILYQDEFRSWEAKFQTGNVISSSMKIDRLADLINRGLGFYKAFMTCYKQHIRSYTKPKQVTGRIFSDQTARGKITLLANAKRGLYGFRSNSSNIIEETKDSQNK
jgi:hypothetical protein